MNTVRTRFAPSPTGYMHIGNLRTALYTYLFARKSKGVFMLRIEDTDQERFVPGATEKIYEGLRLAGISWDEGPDVGGDYGPYVQSERKDSYLPYARQLVESGHAYYCFCTKDELDARRKAKEDAGGTFKYDKHCLYLSKDEVQARLDRGEPYVIRQNIPATGEASFDDLLYGHITVDCEQLDDNVLIKTDGMPTYNFANVVDDHTMAITHVMRGNEYLSSAPKYNLLYDAFGWEKPVYVHLNQVMKDHTRKLSKRYGDPSFEDLLEQGFLPEAIVNYVAFLGWNPGDNREIFSLDDLTRAFSLEGLSKSPAIFDLEKLRWYSGEYIKAMAPEAFRDLALKWLKTDGFPVERFDADVLCALLQPRVETVKDMGALFGFLLEMPAFDPEIYTHKKMKTDTQVAREALTAALPALKALDDWSADGIHECLKGVVEAMGVKNGQVLWPVRIAISGLASTPGGATEIAFLLGKSETVARMEASLKALS